MRRGFWEGDRDRGWRYHGRVRSWRIWRSSFRPWLHWRLTKQSWAGYSTFLSPGCPASKSLAYLADCENPIRKVEVKALKKLRLSISVKICLVLQMPTHAT